LVIADAQKPIAIAGIMGGEYSSVSEKTKIIILEAATFDPLSIRKTARALNLHSDSSDRFEKGLSTELTEEAIWRAAELISKLAGGKVVGNLIDKRIKKYQPIKVKLNLEEVERYLGVKIPPQKIIKILTSLGFKPFSSIRLRTKSAKSRSPKKIPQKQIITFTVPYWRDHDIFISEDLIEEIARIYGYHNLPTALPTGEIPIKEKNWELFWEKKIKEILAGAGMTEIYSYSFVSAKLLESCGYKPSDCLKLLNPLSIDLEYMRNSLIPSVLQVVAENQSLKDEFKIFELSRVYFKKERELPDEKLKICGALVGQRKDNRLFYEAKGIVELLFKKLGITNYEFRIIKEDLMPWNKPRTAEIIIDHMVAGYLGEPRATVLENFGIKKQVVLFGLDFERLVSLARVDKTYNPLPKFPSIELDLAILVPENVLWEDIRKAILEINNQLIKEVKLFDIFEGGQIPLGQKSLAFRVAYQSNERTLKLEEAKKLEEQILERLGERFGAKLRR